jgi:excisionase family DNA binding protein
MRNERLTVSVEEAAEILGISRALAYSLVARQELPSLKLGRRVLVPRSALHRMLELEPSSSTSDDRGAS